MIPEAPCLLCCSPTLYQRDVLLCVQADAIVADKNVTEHTLKSRQRQKDHDTKKFANVRKSWASKKSSCGEECGFYVRDGSSIRSCIEKLPAAGAGCVPERRRLLLLVEDGVEWDEVINGSRVPEVDQHVLIMGDNVGLTAEEDREATALGAIRVRLGSVPMLASHCIVVAHHLLDRLMPPKASDEAGYSKLKDVRVHATHEEAISGKRDEASEEQTAPRSTLPVDSVSIVVSGPGSGQAQVWSCFALVAVVAAGLLLWGRTQRAQRGR